MTKFLPNALRELGEDWDHLGDGIRDVYLFLVSDGSFECRRCTLSEWRDLPLADDVEAGLHIEHHRAAGHLLETGGLWGNVRS